MKYRKDGRGRFKLAGASIPAGEPPPAHSRAGLYTEAIGHGFLLIGALAHVFIAADGHYWWALVGYTLLLILILLRLNKVAEERVRRF